MNAERLPDTQTASVSAMLSADGSSSASSRSRSVRTSPARTRRFDPPAASACRYRATSALVMVDRRPACGGVERMHGQDDERGHGLGDRTDRAHGCGISGRDHPVEAGRERETTARGRGDRRWGGCRRAAPWRARGCSPSQPVVRAVSFTATNVAAVTTSAAITATNTIHTHDVRRDPVIRPVYARRPVACLRASPGDDAASATASRQVT